MFLLLYTVQLWLLAPVPDLLLKLERALLLPAARTHVARNDHPLGDSPATQDSFTHVSQPERTTRLDRVESEEGDENEEGKEEGLSNQDKALSAGEGSFYGGGSEFGSPSLADLVELNEPCCRVPTRVASLDGSKVTEVWVLVHNRILSQF